MGILDSLSKNPSIIALAALGIGLFIFRDKISDFFSNISGGAEAVGTAGEISNTLLDNLQGNLTGQNDLLNSITEFFTGGGDPLPAQPTPEAPTFNFEFPDLGEIFGGLFPPAQEEPQIPQQAFDAFIPTSLPEERPLNLAGFFTPPVSANVQTGLDTGQQFQGGGPSFIGGSVSEIPLERLSLGQIIERLGVTASQAASLRAEAIGFTPGEQSFLNQGQEISPLGDLANTPQSSEGFQGLTPQEIALRLTGGIISNF